MESPLLSVIDDMDMKQGTGPVHTGYYVNRALNHPGTTKRGVFRTKNHRTVTIGNTPEILQKEFSNIRSSLRKCGYADELTDKV